MGAQVVFITAAGLLASLVVLVLALRAGRTPPLHRWMWVAALIALGVSMAFRMVLIVGAAVNESFETSLPVLLGNLAVLAVFAAAFWRPAWAGWFLIGTAVAMPLANFIAELTMSGLGEQTVGPAMLGFYAVPAAITGVLLVMSERWHGRHAKLPPAQPTPQ